MAIFTVDTHLFRELGELLVGRDSTALVELIKNSYDADANHVVVLAQALSNPEVGFIRIVDDGVGMTRTDFENGFLRIASRAKELGDRRSVRFNRRYTGAKGVGRLAAHKLARMLEVESIPFAGQPGSAQNGLRAVIDWDLVEEYETLDQLDGTPAIRFAAVPRAHGSSPGTTITLRRLRHKWTGAAHGRFMAEVQTFEVPDWLTAPLANTVVSSRLLFDRPVVRDAESTPEDKGFKVSLDGDLAPPEDFWITALAAANWVIEIDADRSSGQVCYAVAPTLKMLDELPDARSVKLSIEHPHPSAGPFFQARILIRTGALREGAAVRSWMGSASGIRVFLEGFRILPYGEPRNDWLALDRDYAERERRLLSRPGDDPLAALLPDEEALSDEGLVHLPNKHFFGGVFLTESQAGSLRLLVNREGFVPDSGYESLVRLVRVGVDIATRARAAATHAKRAKRKTLRAAAKDGSVERMPSGSAIRAAVSEARSLVLEARQLLAKRNPEGAASKVAAAVDRVEEVTNASDDIAREGAMLRVLASVGTQLASFVHEINGLLGMAQSLENAVERLRKELRLRPEQRHVLAEFARATGDLKRNLERQASYLIDVVSPDARRRRSRQSLAERFDAGLRLVSSSAERTGISIQNGIARDLRSPPMFPAELTTVFGNLLTNAIKAAGRGGRIRAVGRRQRDGSVVIRIENSGAKVKPDEGERWFRPFESSTSRVDPVLGQGMGLGLPITRSVLEEYGATIQFTKPSSDFATALELVFPE